MNLNFNVNLLFHKRIKKSYFAYILLQIEYKISHNYHKYKTSDDVNFYEIGLGLACVCQPAVSYDVVFNILNF